MPQKRRGLMVVVCCCTILVSCERSELSEGVREWRRAEEGSEGAMRGWKDATAERGDGSKTTGLVSLKEGRREPNGKKSTEDQGAPLLHEREREEWKHSELSFEAARVRKWDVKECWWTKSASFVAHTREFRRPALTRRTKERTEITHFFSFLPLFLFFIVSSFLQQAVWEHPATTLVIILFLVSSELLLFCFRFFLLLHDFSFFGSSRLSRSASINKHSSSCSESFFPRCVHHLLIRLHLVFPLCLFCFVFSSLLFSSFGSNKLWMRASSNSHEARHPLYLLFSSLLFVSHFHPLLLTEPLSSCSSFLPSSCCCCCCSVHSDPTSCVGEHQTTAIKQPS